MFWTVDEGMQWKEQDYTTKYFLLFRMTVQNRLASLIEGVGEEEEEEVELEK